MTESADLLDRIVAGVLEQLQAPSAPASKIDRAPSVAAVSNGQSEKSSTNQQPAATSYAVEIADKVITAAVLEKSGVIAGPVRIAPKAILTPSAVEFLASRKIRWTRDNATATVAVGAVKWLGIVSRTTPAVDAVLETLANQSGIEWKQELVGCHREGTQRALSAVCRGECDAVLLFTGRPAAVACLANRNPQLRAAVVDTVETAKSVKREIGANVFALDPRNWSVFALRSLLREIVAGGKPVVPSAWNE